MAFNYSRARQLLEEAFSEAQDATAPVIPDAILGTALDRLFISSTQSYREALIGCALARMVDPDIDIRKPYVKQGERAFNGRTLDESVINPFLRDRTVPCSKGPYLASFRRNVEFVPATAGGLRDQDGYAAFLKIIVLLEAADRDQARAICVAILHRFIALRDLASILLSRINRLSLDQFSALVAALLRSRTGGLASVLLSVALMRAVKACHGLDWTIEFQGINTADSASGAGGDITVLRDGSVLFAIEVTQRVVDRARVVATFRTKVAPVGIQDYLFVYAGAAPPPEARQEARLYFGQGHDMNFVPLLDWVINTLAGLGAPCRTLFIQEILTLLDMPDTPAGMKVAWNDAVNVAIGA